MTPNTRPMTRHAHRLHTARGTIDQVPAPVSNRTGILAHDARGETVYGDADGDPWDEPTAARIAALCPSVDHDADRRPQRADHPRRELDHQGTTLYVAHPYDLHDEAWADFQALTAAGYTVNVSGASCYFPGRTIRVELTPPTA